MVLMSIYVLIYIQSHPSHKEWFKEYRVGVNSLVIVVLE